MRAIIFLLSTFAVIPLPATASVDFNRDIRPILSDKCFACHGPDEETREADLRLDTYQGATTELDGGKALDPDHLEDSEILFRIESDDKDEIMPPPKTGKPLTEGEITLLKEWIAGGGNYDTHWAYTPIQSPEPPPVSDPSRVRNGIDSFILARLDPSNLKPAPEADQRALLRRTSLDLTGLPPTPEEVRTFLADDSEDAFEKAIDRLLASP
ncbi:MAG: DUF1549 domain-containing protein, partial [Akkermansiaceae bacterium]|nr:DUF1549 domain-containing protein [Akkermansiaceae bacterium]